MKGARNILVHRYAHVVDEKIYAILENHLLDFEEFNDAVMDILKPRQNKKSFRFAKSFSTQSNM